MASVYLSRRNLLTLLAKLDRVQSGQKSACTLVKSDFVHPRFPQSMDEIRIVAVEGACFYSPGSSPLVALSRASLLYLLAQLGQVKARQSCDCVVVVDALKVHAVEDDDYYAERSPGEVLPLDDPDVAPAEAIRSS